MLVLGMVSANMNEINLGRTKVRKRKKPLGPPNYTRLLKVYGITRKLYDKIRKEQGDACYICRRDPRKFSTRKYQHNLCVDHCHTTGRIRGLLCKHCNTQISRWLNDDPEKGQRAVTYLTRIKRYGKVPNDV